MKERADRRRPPIWPSNPASLDLVLIGDLIVCLVGRHAPRSERNDQRLELLQVVVCFDGLNATVVELRRTLEVMGERQG